MKERRRKGRKSWCHMEAMKRASCEKDPMKSLGHTPRLMSVADKLGKPGTTMTEVVTCRWKVEKMKREDSEEEKREIKTKRRERGGCGWPWGERERETGMCWLPFLWLGLFLPLCLLTSLLAQGAHYSSLLDQNPPPWKWRHFHSWIKHQPLFKVSLILNPPPTSLPIPSLWVIPDSCQSMTKPPQYCKVISLQLK